MKTKNLVYHPPWHYKQEIAPQDQHLHLGNNCYKATLNEKWLLNGVISRGKPQDTVQHYQENIEIKIMSLLKKIAED